MTNLKNAQLYLVTLERHGSKSYYIWNTVDVVTSKQTRKLCYCKDDRAMRAIDREPLRRYGHSKLSKMAAAAILNLFESKIAPLDRRPRKPYPRTKHEVDRITRCRDMAIRVCWGTWNPIFWGRGSRRGVSDSTIRKSDGSFL